MELGILLYDWSGYVNEMGDAIDTSLVGLSRLMTFLATLHLVGECVVLFSSFYNELVRDLTF